MEEPKISVVIPTYNCKKYLKEAIDSCVEQTFKPYEIIVVDDGSTDGTHELCREYGNKIKYIYKPNGGTASALNVGIKEMTGDWFKWLSADDVLFPNGLEILVKKAGETGEKVFYADYYIIDENSKLIGVFKEPKYPNHYAFRQVLWFRFIGNGSASMIHKSCFEKVGLFDETLRYGEDYLMWLKLASLYRFINIGEFVIKYRRHPEQLSMILPNEIIRENDEEIRRRAREWGC